MVRTLEISEETYEKIKAQLNEGGIPASTLLTNKGEWNG